MSYPIIAVTLYLFWVLLSGHFTLLLLSLGGLSVGLTVWFLRRMDQVDGEGSFVRLSAGLIGYVCWLYWNVVKSCIDVVIRIWDPKLPINPTWQRIETDISTPLKKTLYANSITLTPGTITTNARRDHLWIHSLSSESLAELQKGEMERRIQRLKL
jgi:multicomponent Na+:H+ antiporter subunit E